MGNWTTVNIIGKCDKEDLPELAKAINIGDDWDKFHCLCNTGPSLCGLGDWSGEVINATGNLSERDYGADSVAEQLEELKKVAPSLNVKVHVGGDYESTDCVSTVTCNKSGVKNGKPEIETLSAISPAQLQGNLMKCLMS